MLEWNGMTNQDPTNYNETVDQLAENCAQNFFSSYPPIQYRESVESEIESGKNYNFSVSVRNASEICDLIEIVTQKPSLFLSKHAERHSAEIPEAAYYIKEGFQNNQLAMKTVEQHADLTETPNGLLIVPRYLITTKEKMVRQVTRFLPTQYAIELSHLNVDSKSKSKHIRRLLEIDPALGIMTGISLVKASTYTRTPQFVHEDFFRALGDKLDFFTENNPEHQESILNMIKEFKNVYNSSEYEDTLEELYEIFPNLPNSQLARTKGEFTDVFKPLMLFSSSEGHLQSYLRMHPEIKMTPTMTEALERKGLFGKMTSHVISSYLNHQRAPQVLSKCHTQDNWGLMEFCENSNL
jgi:hypothetical protein